MDRLDLLQALENKYIPIETYRTINGELFASIDWRKVEYQAVTTQFGQIQLGLYSDEGLKELLGESMGQAEYQAIVMGWQKEYQKVAG